MDQPKKDSKLELVVEHLLGFLETKSELLKLEIKEELIKSTAPLVAWMLNMALVLMFVLFISIALSNYFNHLFESNYWGYVLLAAIFLILGLLLLALRRTKWFHRIIVYFTEKIVSRSLKHEDEG